MPVAVRDKLRPGRVENLEGLGAVGFGIRRDFLAGELRPRRRAPARIADHGSKIANDQNRLVPKILKLAELSQNNRVSEMQIRAGGINPELHPKRPAKRELRPQFLLANDLGSALFKNGKRFVGLHEPRVSVVAESYLLLFNNSRTCSTVSGLFCV